MNATQTPAERIEAIAAELGLTMEAKFIPWSQSRNAGEKNPSLNWRIVICRKHIPILNTLYSAGCGHCPSYKQHFGKTTFDSNARDAAVKAECETGKPCRMRRYQGFDGSMHDVLRGKPTIQPKLADVISSLVMESDALDCGSFDEWAEALGYDTDSRKAEAIYRACLETGLKLRNALGEKGLQQLREACQDY